MKKKIIITLAIALVLIVTAGTIFVINVFRTSGANPDADNTPPQNNTEEPAIIIPTLSVPSTLSVDANQSIVFTYTIQDLGDYLVRVYIADENIATIDTDGVIFGKVAGTTIIYTEINCSPIIKKQTVLTVNAVVTDISYRYLNLDYTEASILYVNNSYYLEITENQYVTNTPTIEFDENYVDNFSLYSKNDKVLLFKFTVINYGNISFKYISKYVTKNTSDICAYVYPSNFEVNLSVPCDNNVVNLYLFDNSFIAQANADGFYNSASLSILTTQNSNESIDIVCSDSNIAKLEDNTLTAISCGSCTLTFTSLISLVSKEYLINVYNVPVTSIVLNGTEFDLNDSHAMSLALNQPSSFNIGVLPSYALCNIGYEHSADIEIVNNLITLKSLTTQTVYVKLDNVVVLTITIDAPLNYTISSSVYKCNSDYTFNNAVLNITWKDNGYIVLMFEVIDLNTNNINAGEELFVDISNKSIVNTSDETNQIKNNFVTLELLSVGSTTLTIYSNNLDISINIDINIM